MEETIEGFIYDGIGLTDIHGSWYEMRVIWIPSKRLHIDDKGSIMRLDSDRPCGVKAAHEAQDEYIKRMRRGEIERNYAELDRMQLEAEARALLPTRVPLSRILELEVLLEEQEKLAAESARLKDKMSTLGTRLFE